VQQKKLRGLLRTSKSWASIETGPKEESKRREMEKVSEFLKGIQTLEFKFKFEFEQKKEQCTCKNAPTLVEVLTGGRGSRQRPDFEDDSAGGVNMEVHGRRCSGGVPVVLQQ
jgi:hypothetical protein